MQNKTILLVPLDERPCNYGFPAILPKAGYELLLPPLSLMGRKKRPADLAGLRDWVLENVKKADYAILALDTLIYGGLIPSRLHHTELSRLKARADIVREIKAARPGIKLYAFQTIMRCPWYSLSEEEPDYYEQYGSLIHRFGKFTHKQKLGLLSAQEAEELKEVERSLDAKVLEDFLQRREINLEVLLHTLEAVKEGVIDGFVIPQDDSAPYGYTAMDQIKVRQRLKAEGLQLKVPMYPAADDTGMTMLARAVNDSFNVRPRVYVYYSSANGATVVPSFEDRTVDATVKNQILAAGCRRVYALSECDILLAVNIGSEMVYEDDEAKRAIPYDVERSLAEYIDQIRYALSMDKVVAVADVAYPSNSDTELVGLLRDEGLLLKIHAYAGWNTSSNTIGTVLCQAALYLAGKDGRGNRDFLLHRYYDDVGFCSHTRTWLDVNVVPKLGLTSFVLDGERGQCTEQTKAELVRYMREQYPQLAACVEDVEVTCPWNRTFEMEITLKTR